MQPAPDDNLVEELCRLVSSACDGVLTEPERQRLNELLLQGVELRAAYLQYIALHSSLKTTAGNQAAQGIEEFAARLSALAQPSLVELRGRPRSSATARWRSRAAMIGLALIPAAMYLASSRTDERRQATSAVPDDRASAPRKAIAAGPLVRVHRVSADARWQDPNESYAAQADIREGGALHLAQGEVELTYETGVRLLLIGPAEFTVCDGGGRLRRGGLMATVPEAGQGFTIEMPNGKVVDLGTQFGVVVDDFGVSEVSVFEGKVEAFPTTPGGARGKAPKFELTKGRALQWNAETIKTLEADPRRLPFSLAGFSPTVVDAIPSKAAQVASHGARGASEEGHWKVLGNAQRTDAGWTLVGAKQRTQPPYLVSAREFDPTDGPVTVVCDVRFPRLAPDDRPSFAILTRSEDERSKMKRAWSELLATCVRCSFRTTPDAYDGVLETATKYERDRELTGISWRGFRRPQADAVYRLVMRDDGVNVSFSVSRLDDPSVSKTVTCRSLFRGYRNHVALEGWDAGVAVVEQAVIYQESPATGAARRIPDLRAPLGESPQARPDDMAGNPLLALVPKDARLAVADSFADGSLDPEKWTTLGDVAVVGEAAALGGPAGATHIDTFRPRPYLLTRRAFAPRDGKLFVVGTIKFAENFLQGYGGSFAVMTRCNDQYGTGPEWAVSALGTGVRSNFWPASPREDHVLEVHEKLSPDALTFLAGGQLQIAPSSRVYHFCLEDDGTRVALTFQDATDPFVGNSLRHVTDSALLREGFVAFEGCWGSPVLLDEVRIYVQPRQASRGAVHD
ncbi:MAG: FecR domain-containing protein [Pirellulales bacterium]|nr:FecR domain-containing protein [Pirellulales bacterium]